MKGAPRNIVVLGSTGSIGEQTLQVAAEYQERIRVVGLAANRNLARLQEQIHLFRPRHSVIVDATTDVPSPIRRGREAVIEIVTDPDVDLVVVAVVGAAGLAPTLAALGAGKLVALANKEALVMAGEVIRAQLARGGSLVPVDSEHSAIWQCVQGEPPGAIDKLVLTASGGAFRDLAPAELNGVTPAMALAHPTWRMGPKVTVDSATLMNKGLEVIEATLLFDVPMADVDVLIHRESIVHSLVYFSDSSVKAQLGLPDMRLPIQYALTHPDRWPNSMPRLDLARLSELHFGPVDWDRYPCLRLAVEAGRKGGTYPAALCAADEVAVELFLAGRIPFTAISNLVEETLSRHVCCPDPSLDDILHADAMARLDCREAAFSGWVGIV